MKNIEGGICAPLGFKAGGVIANIRGKSKTKKDLALIVSDQPCVSVATYTQNKVKGAPLLVTKNHLKNGVAQAIICNSGNANTCNDNGIEIAEGTCQLVADELSLNEEDIIVASTGVIGEKMTLDPFKNHMKELVSSLHDEGSDDAANAIMTTDTVKKEYAVEFDIDGHTCHIGAIAKGSGMIHPNMATMLAFVTSDINISKDLLEPMVREIVDETFNMVSVDGDTSTNDMLVVMCNGMAGNDKIVLKDSAYHQVRDALHSICESLSRGIAKDGEGATKLLTCHVNHARSIKDARIVAKSVITSSLFKSAMFGEDANWGRILCAIGYSDASFDINQVEVSLSSSKGKILVCKEGAGVAFSEDEAAVILHEDEIDIHIDLHDGDHDATAWGCDLTYDYVKINGDYRT